MFAGLVSATCREDERSFSSELSSSGISRYTSEHVTRAQSNASTLSIDSLRRPALITHSSSHSQLTNERAIVDAAASRSAHATSRYSRDGGQQNQCAMGTGQTIATQCAISGAGHRTGASSSYLHDTQQYSQSRVEQAAAAAAASAALDAAQTLSDMALGRAANAYSDFLKCADRRLERSLDRCSNHRHQESASAHTTSGAERRGDMPESVADRYQRTACTTKASNSLMTSKVIRGLHDGNAYSIERESSCFMWATPIPVDEARVALQTERYDYVERNMRHQNQTMEYAIPSTGNDSTFPSFPSTELPSRSILPSNPCPSHLIPGTVSQESQPQIQLHETQCASSQSESFSGVYNNDSSDRYRFGRIRRYDSQIGKYGPWKYLYVDDPVREDDTKVYMDNPGTIHLKRGGTLRYYSKIVSEKRREDLAKSCRECKQFRQYKFGPGGLSDEPRVHVLFSSKVTENTPDCDGDTASTRASPGYRYHGIKMQAQPLTSEPELESLSSELAGACGLSAWDIGVDLIAYRDGNDYIGWHADDTQRESKVLCIIPESPGGLARPLHIRPKQGKGRRLEHGDEEIQIFVRQGDAYEQDGQMQVGYEHSLPKVKSAKGLRTALIFRHGDLLFLKDSGCSVLETAATKGGAIDLLAPAAPKPIIIGHPSEEFIVEGLDSYSRADLFLSRAHRCDRRGVCGNMRTGAESIVVSRQSASLREGDGLDWIFYTSSSRQGGGAFVVASRLDQAVRVFRSSSLNNQFAPPPRLGGLTSYRYDGLYKVSMIFDENGRLTSCLPPPSGEQYTFLLLRQSKKVLPGGAGNHLSTQELWDIICARKRVSQCRFEPSQPNISLGYLPFKPAPAKNTAAERKDAVENAVDSGKGECTELSVDDGDATLPYPPSHELKSSAEQKDAVENGVDNVKGECFESSVDDGEGSEFCDQDDLNWVQCDRCDKWRILEEKHCSLGKWYCEQNGDQLHNNCDAPQETEDEYEERMLLEASSDGASIGSQKKETDSDEKGDAFQLRDQGVAIEAATSVFKEKDLLEKVERVKMDDGDEKTQNIVKKLNKSVLKGKESAIRSTKDQPRRTSPRFVRNDTRSIGLSAFKRKESASKAIKDLSRRTSPRLLRNDAIDASSLRRKDSSNTKTDQPRRTSPRLVQNDNVSHKEIMARCDNNPKVRGPSIKNQPREAVLETKPCATAESLSSTQLAGTLNVRNGVNVSVRLGRRLWAPKTNEKVYLFALWDGRDVVECSSASDKDQPREVVPTIKSCETAESFSSTQLAGTLNVRNGVNVSVRLGRRLWAPKTNEKVYLFALWDGRDVVESSSVDGDIAPSIICQKNRKRTRTSADRELGLQPQRKSPRITGAKATFRRSLRARHESS